jgi:hypothetical protein
VPPDNPHALRDAIHIMRRNGVAAHFGSSPRRYVERTLVASAALGEYDAFFDAALNGSRPAPVPALAAT